MMVQAGRQGSWSVGIVVGCLVLLAPSISAGQPGPTHGRRRYHFPPGPPVLGRLSRPRGREPAVRKHLIPDPARLQPASSRPVTGGFSRITVERPGAFFTYGNREALVTVRLFSPAPNDWRLWRKLESIPSLIRHLPGPARIEVMPCGWTFYSLLEAISAMMRWSRGEPPTSRLPARIRGLAQSPTRMHLVELLKILPTLVTQGGTNERSSGGPAKEVAVLMNKVLDATALLLSVGAACSRNESPVMFMGGRVILIDLQGSQARFWQTLTRAYMQELSAADKAVTGGLSRRLLSRWQFRRALRNAMEHAKLPTRVGRLAWAALRPRGRRRIIPPGGILVPGANRGKIRVDVFTSLKNGNRFMDLGLLLLQAKASPESIALFLHPIDPYLSGRSPTAARLVVAASLDGSLAKVLSMLLASRSVLELRSKLHLELGRAHAKRLMTMAMSAKVTGILAKNVRQALGLHIVPSQTAVLVDGLPITTHRGMILPMLAIQQALRPGLLSRIGRKGPFAYRP